VHHGLPHLLGRRALADDDGSAVSAGVAAVRERDVADAVVAAQAGRIAHLGEHVVDDLPGAGDRLPRPGHEQRLQLIEALPVRREPVGRQRPDLEVLSPAPPHGGDCDQGDQRGHEEHDAGQHRDWIGLKHVDDDIRKLEYTDASS